jgi:hypothetical protein
VFAELRQRHADGGLAQREILGGMGDAAGFVKLADHFKKSQIDVSDAGHAMLRLHSPHSGHLGLV